MTLSELRAKMRSYANVDSNRLPDDEAADFLNSAMHEITAQYRLRFCEAYITTAFSVDTQTMNPAPSSGVIDNPTRMWYANSAGERVEVSQISWNEYVERWGTAATADNGSGDPFEFAVYGEDDDGNPTFYLGPIPDTATTVYVTARTAFNDLSAADDENQLTRKAGFALVYRALEMAAPFLEDEDSAAGWRTEFDRAIQRVALSHSSARYSAKHLRQMVEPG